MTDKHTEYGHGGRRIPPAQPRGIAERDAYLRSEHVPAKDDWLAYSDPDGPPCLSEEQKTWTDEQWSIHDEKVAQQRAREVAEAAARDRRSTISRMASNGFPHRALEAAEAADLEADALARIRDWRHTEHSLLVLSGAAGCGKTVAATWWALNRCSAATFLRSTSFASSSRYDHEQRRKWLSAQAMVLDDLGTEYADAKGNFQVDLDELIDTFYGDSKPLIITTNCSTETFKARYGERVVDRVRECGKWLSIASKSMRGAK